MYDYCNFYPQIFQNLHPQQCTNLLQFRARRASLCNDGEGAVRSWAPPGVRVDGQDPAEHQGLVQRQEVAVLLADQAFDVCNRKIFNLNLGENGLKQYIMY